MQEEEEHEICYYRELCSFCWRHRYRPPKHVFIFFGMLVNLCSDECRASYITRICYGSPFRTLKQRCINEIVQRPELFDVTYLPKDIKKTIKWALSCKEDLNHKIKGKCDCASAWDCYNRSKTRV
jgi:hypothetical protein